VKYWEWNRCALNESPLNIKYHFLLQNGSHLDFNVKLDPYTLNQIDDPIDHRPDWTALTFRQCSNCPLDPSDSPYCPVAINIIKLMEGCSSLVSYEKVRLDVTTPERTVSKDTTAQAGTSSLLGLIVATSGCPHTGFFKPMARFHLPFASEAETIYRASSMYLLAQYFIRKQGGEADLDMEGLVKIYRNLQIVNTAFAARLRAASQQDAAVNAVVLLDSFAKILPYTIADSLDEIRHLFISFLAQDENG